MRKNDGKIVKKSSKQAEQLECNPALLSLSEGRHGAPYDVLGLHAVSDGLVIRSIWPFAETLELVRREDGKSWAMPPASPGPDGVFELTLADINEPFDYFFRVTESSGTQFDREDPYRFPLVISDFDLYLFGEGSHYRTYKHMGAHLMTIDGYTGTHFAVWAPNATRVSIVGDFCQWDGRCFPMQQRGSSGLWELFIPGLQEGDLYKYEIRGENGYLGLKADPYGFAAELRPQTASRVWDVDKYKWKDHAWLEKRRQTQWHDAPISIYELHPGSWKRVPEEDDRMMTYRELAADLVPYVKDLGFTHIELLPISEHPFDGSWGYQTTGYYAPTSRFGSPNDFKFFIDACHEAGIGVLVDWVPAHYPKDSHGLAFFDGTHLYEHADPRKGEHRDWGTLIFNYGRNEVFTFLLSNALFWADIYHIDGLRVDAVASMLYLDYSREDGEWIPNEHGGRENLEAVAFLKRFNEIVHEEYPGFTTFAEESTAWPMVSRPTYLGGLGFDFKWNMGWMHDSLDYMSKDPIYRKYHHGSLTFSLLYAFTENFTLPFSHDEVVYGKCSMVNKMPGDDWRKFANLRLLYSLMYAHPGKKLLFMGCEFAQRNEWNFDASLDWDLLESSPEHGQMMSCVRDLNRIYSDCPEFHEQDFSWDGFEWVDFHDSEQSVIAFIRKGTKERDTSICVLNFTPIPREVYRLGVPYRGQYEEIFNSDAKYYGGTNIGNAGLAIADKAAWQGQPYSVQLRVPPLGAVFLRWVPPC